MEVFVFLVENITEKYPKLCKMMKIKTDKYVVEILNLLRFVEDHFGINKLVLKIGY